MFFSTLEMIDKNFVFQFRKSECNPGRMGDLETGEGAEDALGIRPSKSDTSLTDSFVMVNNDGEAKEDEPPFPPPRRNRNSHHILRPGVFWLFFLIICLAEITF